MWPKPLKIKMASGLQQGFIAVFYKQFGGERCRDFEPSYQF